MELAGSKVRHEIAMDRIFVFGEEGDAQAARGIGDEQHLADGSGQAIEEEVEGLGHRC
jgi:hypothetical protein